MKVFLILWALGLSACDKLDRTYLPPPGFEAAGGHPDNLDIPLEYPKENYASTSKPGADGITGISSSRPNYSNVASNRQGPYDVTSSDFYTTRTEVPFSDKVYNVRYTTPSYALTQTTTVAPIQSYETTIGSINSQGYPSRTSFDSNSNPKFSVQQNFDVDGAQGYTKNFGSNIPVFASQDTNIGPFLRYSNGSLGFPINPKVKGNPQRNLLKGSNQVSNRYRPVSSNLRPQDSINPDYPSSQYSGQPKNKPEVTAMPPYPNYYDEKSTATYKVQQSPEVSKYSTLKPVVILDTKDADFYGPAKVTASTKVASNQSAASSTITPIQSKTSKYSSTPTTSLEDNFGSPYGTVNQPQRSQAESDRNAIILNYENLLTPDGFAYSYDTSNGIHADESGTAVNGVRAQGSYSYIGDDGKLYSVTYTADENGFLPRGDHLPTAPPIPNAILKVIEQAARNKELGVVDDGSYDDSKYGHGRYQGFTGRKPQEQKYLLGKRPTNSFPVGENISYEKDIPSDDNGHSNLYNADKGNTIPVSSERPYDNESDINGKIYYTNEEMETFVPSDKYDDNSKIYPTNGNLANKNLILVPVTESKGSKANYGSSVLQRSQYDPNNPNIGRKPISGIEEYGENQPSQEGYEYSTPQSVFRPYDLQNSDRERIEIPSESLNGNTQNVPGDKQLSVQSLNYPGSRIIKPSNVYNKDGFKDSAYPKNVYSDGSGAEEAVDTIFSTPKPVYGSTSSRPSYYYTTKIVNDQDDVQQRNYPSQTFKPQYPATTPLSSEYSSPSFSTTNRVYYDTTPTSDQFVTTLRPSVISTTSGSILKIPATSIVSKSRQGPTDAIKASTATPGYVNRNNERFGYRSRPTVTVANDDSTKFVQGIPQRNNEMRPGFDVSDLRTQKFRTSTKPKTFSNQSITERGIGEDFGGPKQQQRYDPEYGYFY